MTTAHRATWNHAKGRGEGREGYNSLGGVLTSSFSSRDLPAQLTLKSRQAGQSSAADLAKRDLKQELLEREARARKKREKGDINGHATATEALHSGGVVENSVSIKKPALTNINSLTTGEEVDDDLAALARFDDADVVGEESDGSGTSSSSGGDSDDDDDDDELELLRELENIKRERKKIRPPGIPISLFYSLSQARKEKSGRPTRPDQDRLVSDHICASRLVTLRAPSTPGKS
jgi:protein CWC15